MTDTMIYHDIAERTNGAFMLGVVGPVRTGKSSFVKRFMETMVIPKIENSYTRERTKDELPQSGSGKTIMTSEPKFVPEEAAEISPDGTSTLRIRMIDSVGYMVDGASGATEDGVARMVTTPWFDHEIPMTEAAEVGTKKVMQEHCTIGLVVTTSPREQCSCMTFWVPSSAASVMGISWSYQGVVTILGVPSSWAPTAPGTM